MSIDPVPLIPAEPAPAWRRALKACKSALLIGAGILLIFGAGLLMLSVLGMPMDAWLPNTVIFTVTYLGLMLLHEVGHAAAGVAVGLRFHGFSSIGIAWAAKLSTKNGEPRTNRQQFFVSISGPLLGGVVSGIILANAGHLIPFVLGVVLALFENVANLVPLGPMDGKKALHSGVALARGHGDEPYQPRPKARRSKEKALVQETMEPK